MNRIILSIFAIMMLGITTYAQEAKPIEPEANPNAPVMTFDEKYYFNNRLVYNYGTIEKGANGQCYFVFTNTGKEPLIIEKATSSCGCTVPNPPQYPILPGQKDSISVKYDTKRVGPINKIINVISNATNSPVPLYISGNIINPEESPAIPENRSMTPVMKTEE